MRDPLILPLAALIAGILADHWLELSHAEFSLGQALWPCAALLVLGAFTPAGWLRRVCLGFGLFFLGAAATAWHRPGPRPSIDADAKELVALEGCVVEPWAVSSGRAQFTLELAPGARARVTLPLPGETAPQQLHYGQRVEIEARIRPPRNFGNPGAFDYETYLARQNIFWTASMPRGTRARVAPGECGSTLRTALFALRGAALRRIEDLYERSDGGAGPDSAARTDILNKSPPDPAAGPYKSGSYRSGSYRSGMMQAILIGDTAKLERIWTEDFRRTGTFHALVISGTHVAVLAGALLFLLHICALPEMAALITTGAAAWLYALVSGFSPPVARAAAGFTLYLIARFFYRRGRVLNLLAAVAILFILCDPASLYDASFQLSFLSVAAIGAIAAPLIESSWGPLAQGLRGLADASGPGGMDPHLTPRVAQFRVELRLLAETLHFMLRVPVHWCARALAGAFRLLFFALEIIAVSLAIQVGLALPMAEYFHRISLTGLSANLVIVPLLDLVVPLGFAAIFTNWHWLAALAGWLLELAAATARWHSALEPNWRVADPPPWLAMLLVISMIAFAVVIQINVIHLNVIQLKFWRWPLGILTAFGFILLLWQPPIPKLWKPRLHPGELELTSIDVGQGDSLLVVFPQGRRMLIDAGGFLQYGNSRTERKPALDTGEDVVSPYLWSRGIRDLDVLVVTHAHEDHMGGANAVLENFHPRELWVGANPAQGLLTKAAALGVRVFALRESEPFEYSGAEVEILSPPEDYISSGRQRNGGNNDSLAFRVAYGANSMLLTGDMESPMEYRLLGEGRLRQTDVLKVGHHGSKTSTTAPFLDALSPSIALISAGFENSFGHPHGSVIERLKQRHISVLRTDYGGLVSVYSDGKRLRFRNSHWPPQEAVPWPAFSWSTATQGLEPP